MSPIDLLRTGIETADWRKICEAYQTLTGQRLDPPTQELENKQLVAQFRNRVLAAMDEAFAALIDGEASRDSVPDAADQDLPEPSARSKQGKERHDREDEADEEGPSEALCCKGEAAKKNVFGDVATFVSQEGVSQAEVQRNRNSARRAAARKKPRPTPQTYSATCSSCEKEYESLRKPTEGIGQLCPKCLRSRPRDGQ